MKDNKSDAIFHPVRIRIVQALFGKRALTAQQLVQVVEGTSIATLYRHLNRLVEAGILAVVEERPVRGTLEKVYALAHDKAADIEQDEVQQLNGEEQMRNFTTLIGTLLNDYQRYLGQEQINPYSDGVMIRQVALNLTDDEAREVNTALKEIIAPYRQKPADPTRRRRMVTLLSLPIVETPEREETE